MDIRKVIVDFFVFLLIGMASYGQDYRTDYNNYKNRVGAEMKRYEDSINQEYSDYRRKTNEEYAQFMRAKWEAYKMLKAKLEPLIPEPPSPFYRENDGVSPDKPIQIPIAPKPAPAPGPVEPPKPEPPKPVEPIPSIPKFDFMFYGTNCSVRLDNSFRIKLKGISENDVADAWTKLSTEKMDALVDDCNTLRKNLSLGDWGYFCLLKKMSDQLFGVDSNEAVLLQTYLMAQSGYKVRIARNGNNLSSLLLINEDVYNFHRVNINGETFCVADKRIGDLYVFSRSFSNEEKNVSMRMSAPPKLRYTPTTNKTFTSKRYRDMSVQITVNKNLIDFYNDYPHCLWPNYAWFGLSNEVKNKLYPIIRASIAGKGQIDAANRIINFVQTAFEYKTDGDQFGYERSLFGDETFFYPYSDCEDRAILFSILIRDILGLDVVLLLYHDHLATAVNYTESLNGYYFIYEGKKYFISDPTYIGANVGECMPNYVNESPKIFKL